jgi:formate/nitrite transporter FocA (FNT family)
MYFIPMGLVLKNQAAVVATAWLDLSHLTWGNFFLENLIPVTIGNIIGWAIFVGLTYAIIYKKD